MIINGKELGSFEIVRYSFDQVKGEPKILIHQIKALDVNGAYIKFAKLEAVLPYLSQYPIFFKNVSHD
jgi:hypothetical protein